MKNSEKKTEMTKKLKVEAFSTKKDVLDFSMPEINKIIK
jgi:hypothetical protein